MLGPSACGPLAARTYLATLSEHPIQWRWFSESPLPDIVVHFGVLSVKRVSTNDGVTTTGHLSQRFCEEDRILSPDLPTLPMMK